MSAPPGVTTSPLYTRDARWISAKLSQSSTTVGLLCPAAQVELHPEADAVRRGSQAFGVRHGLETGSAEADYADLCCWMHPRLPRARVQIAADLVASWFHFDDQVDSPLSVERLASGQRDTFLGQLSGTTAAILEIFRGDSSPNRSTPMLNASVELAERIFELGPRESLVELWLDTLAAYYQSVLAAKRVESLELEHYLRLREDTGAAPALIALGLLLEDVQDDLGAPAQVACIQHAGLLTSLHNDFFSLAADQRHGQRENLVLLCGDMQRAQDMVNESMVEYLQRAVSPGVRRLCDAMITANLAWSLGEGPRAPARRYQ